MDEASRRSDESRSVCNLSIMRPDWDLQRQVRSTFAPNAILHIMLELCVPDAPHALCGGLESQENISTMKHR